MIDPNKKFRSIGYDELRQKLDYDPETGLFRWKESFGPRSQKGRVAGCLKPTGYIVIAFKKYTIMAHRLAWLMMTGSMPERHIDHINALSSDNRWSNLRLCDSFENSWNKRRSKANRSGVKGVSLLRGKWIARVRCRGKEVYLGSHETLESAKSAVRNARMKLHGEFARHE